MDPFQSAYREHHNTETALVKVQNDLLVAADNGQSSILVLLDLSAAFDTIDHSILLDRLSQTFGLSGTVLEWFESYLTGRTQCVNINGEMSSVFKLSFGVPQGSVLGPVLYTMYTKPVSSIINAHGLSCHIYADDTQLYHYYHSTVPSKISSLIVSMQSCVHDIGAWMLSNKLKLNNDKTEIMLFSTKKNVKACDESVDHLIVGNDKILFSEKARNLGVYFDQMLTNDVQVGNICRQMYCELSRIGKLASFLNEKSLKCLVSAFMFSRLDYCNSLLANLPSKTTQRLQRFQNNAARVILKKPKREHVTPLFVHLHWLPVEARIEYKVAVLCHKCLQDKAPSYLSSLLCMYKPIRCLRSGDKYLLNVPKVHTRSFGARSFSYAAPRTWNSLPLSIRQLTDEKRFKAELKTHLFRMYLC